MPIDAQLMDQLFESPQLPSLPTIALRIIELVQEDEVDVEKIAETISLDPALSTKMLKTVNSSFYGMSKTIGSVHQAVVVLGLNSVKTLALGFSLVSNLTDAGGDFFDHMGFWRRSLYSATAAKQLCETLNIVQAEEVFMASLLQDVGVLALAQVLGINYAPIMRQAASDHRKLAPMERESLGGDHIEVGARLAESWGLPPLLVESIRLHEDAEAAPENLRPLIRTVQAGGLAAGLIEDPEDQSRVGEYFSKMSQWFELDRSAADKLLRDVFKHANEAQRLFELPTGELANPDVIVGKASEALRKLERDENQAKLNAIDAGIDPTQIDPTQAAGHAPPEQANAQTAEATPAPAAEPVVAQDAAPAQAAPSAQAAPDKIEPGKPDAQPDDQPDDPPMIDALTGLQNRRRFEELLDEQFLAADADQPLSLVFVDIDQFKRVNDLHGNDTGDAVLRNLAETLTALSPEGCELFRFAEDEFIALCCGVNRQSAAILAETIRMQIEQTRFPVDGGAESASVSLTASIGVATYEGELFKRAEQLVKAASKGVFAAKDGGCNIVRIFVPRAKAKSEAA